MNFSADDPVFFSLFACCVMFTLLCFFLEYKQTLIQWLTEVQINVGKDVYTFGRSISFVYGRRGSRFTENKVGRKVILTSLPCIYNPWSWVDHCTDDSLILNSFGYLTDAIFENSCNDLLIDEIKWEGLNSQCNMATMCATQRNVGRGLFSLIFAFTQYVNTLAGFRNKVANHRGLKGCNG